MDKKQKDPHRTQAISWRDGSEKEEVVNILNSPEVDKHIPEAFKWYQGHNSAGKRVLWACREIKRLAQLGYLEETKPMFGKPEEVEALERDIEELKAKLKLAEGGEVSYVDTINHMERLLKVYRAVAVRANIEVDEEKLRYKPFGAVAWFTPAQK